MRSTVAFNIEDDRGAPLAARLELPAGKARGYALFAHCFTCSKESPAATTVSRELARAGIGVLRFDFTGLGQSGGAFAESSFSSNLEDIQRAADWLSTNYQAPKLLVGHSLGGAAVLHIAAAMGSIKGVATIGAPSTAEHVGHFFENVKEEILNQGSAKVKVGGRDIEVGKSFLTDLYHHSAADRIGAIRADLLILHAPTDAIVGIENAAEIYGWAKHPKSFISLDRADHLLSKREDGAFAASVISAWARRALGEQDDLAKKGTEGKVLVSRNDEGRFVQDIYAGRHRLRADEPSTIEGGLDSGPAPYDFLLSGLGACTSMTIKLYAERKGWPLEHCEVELVHKKEKAPTAECPPIDKIERVLRIEGNLSEAQRAALLSIADRCPVHRTLENGQVSITTQLKT